MRSFLQFIIESKGIENYLENKYKNVKLDIYEKDDLIELSRIIVPEDQRGEGIGSRVMTDLIQYADKHEKDIFLTPSTDFGGTKSRLVKFYKSFGFVPNKGRNKDFRSKEAMIRTYE